MSISKPLLAWFSQHGRHQLPWQTGDPYHVWLSEIMLQQTQVATVIPYFQKFTKQFPEITSLANADLDHVLSLWAGLGYYARARNLHRAANIVAEEHDGVFPADLTELMSLPGIGRSTAGAILAQAFEQPAAILDGNVKRVLSRLHQVEGWYGQKGVQDQLWLLAEKYTPKQDVAAYTQAIMDLGATVCTRSKPACGQCPLSQHCQAHQQGTTDVYPHKKPKKVIPERSAQWLILSTQSGQIFLEQCQEKLWGGLWLFPACESDADPITLLTEKYASTWAAQQKLPTLSHTFTHFRLQIEPILFLVQKKHFLKTRQRNSRWIELHQIDSLAIPTPVKKVLKSLS